MKAPDATDHAHHVVARLCREPDCQIVHVDVYDGDGSVAMSLLMPVDVAETLRDQLTQAIDDRIGMARKN